jgi:hypothetical protein
MPFTQKILQEKNWVQNIFQQTRCLIYNANLRKILSFSKILDLKNTLKENFCRKLGCAFKKILHCLSKCVFHRRKFPKLLSKMEMSFVNEASGH